MKTNMNIGQLAICMVSILFLFSCVKTQNITIKKALNQDQNEMVYTPAGLMPRSQVHLIKQGYRLNINIKDSILEEVQVKTNKVIESFGKINKKELIKNFGRNNISSSKSQNQVLRKYDKGNLYKRLVPTYGSGWITYAGWTNTGTSPINYVSTSWKVPSTPLTYDQQTIFIFDGLQNNYQNGTDIIQPVLQYGVSAAGGGNYWAIANWCVVGTQAFYSPLVAVTTGTILQGIITFTGQAGGSYNYQSTFTGYPQTTFTVNIENVEGNIIGQQYWVAETLEAYNIVQYSDYPPDSDVAMSAIQIETGGNNASLSWTPYNAITDAGQHTVIVSNNSPNGEVDLYFHQPNPLINFQDSYYWYTTGEGSGEITSTPGLKVYVTISAYGPSSGAHITNFYLNGAQLSGPQGNGVHVENGSTTQYFIMPDSGIVDWEGGFSTDDSQGFGDIGVSK
jgi:hypothetical protein